MTATRSRTELAADAPPRARTAAGVLLLVVGGGVLLAIITAEALYPAAYSANRNTVSDLAAMRPDDVVRQPSAAIFNTTMLVAGVLTVLAAVLLYRARTGLVAVLPVGAIGLGMIRRGSVPGQHRDGRAPAGLPGDVPQRRPGRDPHRSAPVRVLRPVQIVLGVTALAFLLGYTFFGELAVFDRLGEGGVERWIVYPVTLWMVVLGTGLAAREQAARSQQPLAG